MTVMSDLYGGARREVLRCGHLGVAVIGTFYACTVKGCDGAVRCPKCGDRNVEPFRSELVPEGSYHCMAWGHIWVPGE